jgi:signal transduction histidine kinase
MSPDDQLARDVASVASIPAVPSILDVVCRMTGMGFATVARVTDERWIACSVKDTIAFGLAPGGELKIETTICNEIREHREPVVINNVDTSPFAGHRTPAIYGFKSYISMPIILPDGSFFGTLCAIDPRPAQLDDPKVVAMFKLFAELIAFHLDAIDRMAASEANLSSEREMAGLREQFIAVLGHDLRNPLAAIDAGVHTLAREPLSARGLGVIALTRGAIERMSRLIDDVLDFARTRMGNGIDVERTPTAIAPLVSEIIDELRAAHPDSVLTVEMAPMGDVWCDPSRLGQLFSNLVANAITHGNPVAPVFIRAATTGNIFEFSVENAGDPIPPEAMERLFAPFARGELRPSQQGLGLGLYIASEVARAHGGALTVTSTEEATRFTFRMPT